MTTGAAGPAPIILPAAPVLPDNPASHLIKAMRQAAYLSPAEQSLPPARMHVPTVRGPSPGPLIRVPLAGSYQVAVKQIIILIVGAVNAPPLLGLLS